MIVPQDKGVIITTGELDVRGFTFAVLGADPADGSDPPTREQFENPVFTADQLGNPFQVGVIYRFEASHPDYVPEARLVRVIFSEDGTYKTIAPGENAPGGSGGSGGNSGSDPDLQRVSNVGAVTTLDITTGGYKRPVGNFATGVQGIAIWQNQGLLERIEKVSVDFLKQLLNAQQTNYNLGITVNTCSQVGGFLFNPAAPGLPSSAKLYIDDAYVGNITANAALPALAAQYGIPADSLIIWSFAIPASYQNNLVHTIEIRHISTGASLGSVFSPGTCGIQTDPQANFIIDSYWEEIPAQPGSNPPPTVVDPIGDQNLQMVGDWTVVFSSAEFSDPGDFLTYNTTGWNGSSAIAFPAGVVYNADRQTLFIPGSLPTGTSFVFRRSATDTAGQVAAYNRLLTINRPTGGTGVYTTQQFLLGTIELVEGGAEGKWWVREDLSDGTNRIYTGGGTPKWKGAYPNGAVIYGYSSAGYWYAKILANTLEGDVPLTMTFELPDKRTLELTVQAKNADTPNRSPVLNVPRQWNIVAQGISFTLPFSSGNPANQWSDPDGDPLSFTLQISNDGGLTYTNQLPSWLTTTASTYGGIPPVVGSQRIYKLRTICSDGRGGAATDDFNLITNMQA